MSVIVALVSKLDGVAASDGRTFGSVHLVNGVAEGQAGVSSDEFDKTFSLDNGRVIGAYCGLMSFSGATVAEHIIHMVGTIPQVGMDFSSIVEQVKEGMTAMLNGIDDCEVIRSCRGIDLLLVAGRRLTRRRHAIASIRFLPVDGVVTTEVDLVEADSSQPLRYYVYGEEQARPAAVNVLAGDSARNTDAQFLKRLAQGAIRAGIRAAGPHQHSPDKACGGQIFTKRTYYP